MQQNTANIALRPRSVQVEDNERHGEIERVRVYGYKSIASPSDVQLAPLTLLAGANSSGKSSLFQPILLVKQTIESSLFDPGSLLLDGPNIQFNNSVELFTRLPDQRKRRPLFGIGFYLSDGRQVEINFVRNPSNGEIKVRNTVLTVPNLGIDRLSITPKLSPAAIAKLKAIPSPFTKMPGRLIPAGWVVTERRCFLEVSQVFEEGSDRGEYDLRYELHSPINDLVQEIEYLVGQVIHLPGLRSNPARAYVRTVPGSSTYPGQFQEYVASILYRWQSDSKLNAHLQELGRDLEALGLTSKVKVDEIDDTRLELKVGRLPHLTPNGPDDLVNIADVGLGTSQILPVLVALRAAVPGQLVLLEQPEVHLHPRAQSALASVLVSAATRGVRVVVETHSALLLRSIQTLIASGAIPPNDVRLHWFTRDLATGLSKITTADVDELGRFGDWPEDFDDVILRTEGGYLEAIARKRALR